MLSFATGALIAPECLRNALYALQFNVKDSNSNKMAVWVTYF